jgi:hypothetical protein
MSYSQVAAPLSAEELKKYGNLWGMSGWSAETQRYCEKCIQKYVTMLGEFTYFTEGVMFNRVMTDQLFMVCAVSTGESTALMTENIEVLGAGLNVEECYWARFQVYMFHNCILGNIGGMTDPRHRGQMQEYNLGHLIMRLAETRGMNQVQARALLRMRPDQGTLVSALGHALTVCGVPTWWFVDTGLCMSEYAGIDVYVKYLSPSILDTSGHVARWVLNVSQKWYERHPMRAELWWRCCDWLAYGQREDCFTYDAVFGELKARILNNVADGLALAHTRYQNEPNMMYALLTQVMRERRELFRIPILRHHWMECSIIEKRMREQREEQVRRGMDPLSVQAAMPNTQVLPSTLRSALRNRI